MPRMLYVDTELIREMALDYLSYLWKKHFKSLSDKHQGTNSSRFKGTLQNLTVKLRGIVEVGMRQKEWWSVKIYWALSLRECGQQPDWRQQQAQITVSTRNQREPVGNYWKELHLFSQLLTGPWGRVELLAAAIFTISPPAPRYFMRMGTSLLFPFHSTRLLLSNQKMTRKIITQGHGRNNNNTTERSFCQWKLVLNPRNLSVINRFIAMSAFTTGVAEARIRLTLDQWEKVYVL